MRRAIARKRDGESLEAAIWRSVVPAFMDGAVDEAQMAALCMACVLRGMNDDETFALTEAMVESGERIVFPPEPLVFDKHSTGGVSDIVSLIAVPLAAACGLRVAKLSGRALGHTGGTLDKLEAIPGVRTDLSPAEFTAQVERIGCAIAAQSGALVPADKRLYALRDRTATVPSVGLIAASIVSKKIAGGAHAIVFDVKYGAGAFMRTLPEAVELAGLLQRTAQRFGRRCTVLVTEMEQPLGSAIGTGLEIIEARDLLRRVLRDDRDGHHARPRALAIAVVTAMLTLGGLAPDLARERAERAWDEALYGAYERFVAMIEAQGGTRAALEAMEPAKPVTAVQASRGGWVTAIDVVRLGETGRALSARSPSAGLRIAVRLGDRVERGQPLAFVCGGTPEQASGLSSAFTLSDERVEPPPLIAETLRMTSPVDERLVTEVMAETRHARYERVLESGEDAALGRLFSRTNPRGYEF